MPNITLPLIILSLAALSPACLPSGDGGPSSSSADTSDAESFDLPFGSPCTRDVQCARLFVCESGKCAFINCTIHGECGEDDDPSNARGCYKRTGRCTAQDCVTSTGQTCEDFGLTGECDGRVCQD